MAESQSQSQDKASGKLYVVGIGPGSVEQLTLKARDVILNADYVLGNSTYLDQMESLLGSQEVIRSYMGKEVERARKAVELAKTANVVMISGGDTNVYGMAGIVLEVAEHENLDVDIEILPGGHSGPCRGKPPGRTSCYGFCGDQFKRPLNSMGSN